MRVLFAWEMGHNFGHATQIAMIARALKSQSTKKKKPDIWMALKTPAAGMAFADDFAGRILQAPFHAPQRAPNPPLTYAEGLVPCGYGNPETLASLITSWRALFDLVKPDVLVAQAAPTALLASRGMKFKRMALGNGFDAPPLTVPMPQLTYWDKPNPYIKAREAEIVNTINAALKILKLKPIKSFAEGLQCDQEFLCVFPELDHYRDRKKTEYLGTLFVTDKGKKISWNKKAAKRIFVYINPGPPYFMACIEALRALPANHDVIIVCKELSPDLVKKLETPSLRIIQRPVRLDNILSQCDLAITNANPALGSALALAGVPSLMLPLHIEQQMGARAMGRAGLGIGLIGNIKPQDVAQKIVEVLGNPKYRESAKAMAAHHKGFSPEKLAKKIAQEIAG